MSRHRWRRRGEALLGGVCGTAVMSASIAIQRRVRTSDDGLIDYDASDHVVVAASKFIRWDPSTENGRRAFFYLVHFGYGSIVALEYERLRRELGSEPRAMAAFFAACQTMALTVFPLLGDTPAPWRWRRDLLVTSVAQHALYASTVAATSHVFRVRKAPPLRASLRGRRCPSS